MGWLMFTLSLRTEEETLQEAGEEVGPHPSFPRVRATVPHGEATNSGHAQGMRHVSEGW